MVNIEDMSIESIKKHLERMEKEVDESHLERMKKEVDYTVGSYKNITFNSGLHNLDFGKGASINSLRNGEGVSIMKNKIKRIVIDDPCIKIYLKGAKDMMVGEVIWEGE